MAKRAENRPDRESKRIPVSGNRNVMTVAKRDPAYVYRWVNDNNDGRIDRFKIGGYEFVEQGDHVVGDRDVDSSRGTSSHITKMVGKDVTAYLMRIKKEFYEEDQIAKATAILDTEEDIKRELNSGQEDKGTYGEVKFDK